MTGGRPETSLDVALIHAALSGRRESARRLVERLMPVLCASVRRALRAERGGIGNVEDAYDLSQDIWLHLVADGGRRLRAYDPARGISLESYVAILAEREVVSRHRRAAAQKRGGHLKAVPLDDKCPLSSTEPNPEDSTAAQQLVAALHSSLERELPERGRLVWRYTFADGRNAGEVAELIGVNVQVIYNWQHKIRNLARAFFDRQRDS